MNRSTMVAVSVAVAVIIVVSGLYLFDSTYRVNRDYVKTFSNNSVNYTIDPFANSSGTMFTVNFTLVNFTGGDVEFIPTVILDSSFTPDNSESAAMLFNLSKNGPYGFQMYADANIYSTGGAKGEGQNPMHLTNTSSFTAGGLILLWNDNGNWDMASPGQYLGAGTYDISYNLLFNSTQDRQAALNLTSGRAVVNLISFEFSSMVKMNSGFTVENLAVVSHLS